MSGQRASPSLSVSIAPPATSRPKNVQNSSHRPHRERQVSSGSQGIQQPPAQIIALDVHPINSVQSPSTDIRPSAPREDSRRSHRRSTKTPISPSASPEATPPEREHKMRSSPSKPQPSTSRHIPKPPTLNSSSYGEPAKIPSPPIVQPIQQMNGASYTRPALVGAYLLTHPLAQLSLLIDLALSNCPDNNQAPARFLHQPIASAITGIKYVLTDINDLNFEMARSLLPTQPKSEQEWQDVAWSLSRRIETGSDESSVVLRVASEVVKIDWENRWRSSRYWWELRRMEKWEERNKGTDGERRASNKGREENSAGDIPADTEGLTLDSQGIKLSGIKKAWREMSSDEKSAAGRAFYEVLRRELKALPQIRDGVEAVLQRESKAVQDMKSAIETVEEMRDREDREAEQREEKVERKSGSRRETGALQTVTRDSEERRKEPSTRTRTSTAVQVPRASNNGQLGERTLTVRSRAQPRRSGAEEPNSSLDRNGLEGKILAARG